MRRLSIGLALAGFAVAAHAQTGGNGVARPAVLPVASRSPHVATNAALAAIPNALYPQGVWRDHYAAGGVADGPLFFVAQTGTCAANSWVNDGGNCVDGPDGNSWKALHQNNILNAKEFGALGDGSTDDTAAIKAAVAAASSATPGIQYDYVVFPSGNYCISTAGGVTAAAPRLALIGYGNAILKVCGAHDTTVLTLNGLQSSVGNLQILGYNSPLATQTTLVIGSSCTECTVDSNTLVQYGAHAISNAAADAKIWAKAGFAYGSSVAISTAGAFWLRNKFDQNYPAGAPPTAPYTLAAWAGTHAYVNKDLVTIATGAWLLQQTGGNCTSGGVEPAVAAYGTNITDGTCTWQLAAPWGVNYAALELQSGAEPNFVDKLDATGTYAAGVRLDAANGGGGPQLTTLRDINVGQALNNGILAANGQGLFIEGGSVTNCVLAACGGISFTGTWSDKAHIGDGFLAYNNPLGIYVGGGVGLVINGASVHGASNACVSIAAGVSQFTVSDSDFSTGPTWGTCAVAVNVAAGASDFYRITDNLLHGATTSVTDGGTGTHKTVETSE